ncbi:MAG: hypothetical protein AAFP19_01475 [Bacteroidota bacterium]
MKIIKHFFLLCLLIACIHPSLPAQNTSQVYTDFTCNNCDANAIRTQLINKGFYSYPIEIGIGGPITLLPNSDVNSNRNGRSGVTDYAKLNIKFITDEFNMADEIEHFNANSPLASVSALTGGFVTSNENLCDDQALFDQICSEFDDLQLGYWAHIWRASKDDNFGFLYVLGKSPSASGNTPVSGEHTAFINQGLAFLDTDPSSYSYGLKYRQKSQVMFSLLADNSVTDYNFFSSLDDTDPLCNGANRSEVIGLAISGMPIAIEPRATLIFHLNPKLDGYVPPGALTGFNVEVPGAGTNRPVDRYRGLFVPNSTDPARANFLGFIGLKTGEYYPSQTSIQQRVKYDVLVGTIDEADACPYYVINNTGFVPAIPVNSIAAGQITDSFENTGRFEGGNISATVFEVCLPSVSRNQIINPQEVRLFPEIDKSLSLYTVIDDQGAQRWVANYLDFTDPDNPTYLIWNTNLCIWQIYYAPPEPHKMHFLEAILKVLHENGHTALDVAGIIPVVGPIADAINGAWYGLDGDYVNATLAIAAVVPWSDIRYVGDAIQFISNYTGKALKAVGKLITKSDGTQEFVDLKKIISSIRDAGFTPEEAKKLVNDLNGSDKLLEYLNTASDIDRVKLVNAWKIIDEVHPTSRADIDLLQKMVDDISVEPYFEVWIKNNPQHFETWTIWPTTYNSLGDPVKDLLGSGRISHTSEWNQLISEMEAAGCIISFRPGSIAYAPGVRRGAPGQLIIDQDASISALRHEHRHFIDDQAAGFRGFEGVYDPNFRVNTEYNAYRLEVEEMLNLGETTIATQLKNNFLEEVNSIQNAIGPVTDPNVEALIDILINL